MFKIPETIPATSQITDAESYSGIYNIQKNFIKLFRVGATSICFEKNFEGLHFFGIKNFEGLHFFEEKNFEEMHFFNGKKFK